MPTILSSVILRPGVMLLAAHGCSAPTNVGASSDVRNNSASFVTPVSSSLRGAPARRISSEGAETMRD